MAFGALIAKGMTKRLRYATIINIQRSAYGSHIVLGEHALGILTCLGGRDNYKYVPFLH